MPEMIQTTRIWYATSQTVLASVHFTLAWGLPQVIPFRTWQKLVCLFLLSLVTQMFPIGQQNFKNFPSASFYESSKRERVGRSNTVLWQRDTSRKRTWWNEEMHPRKDKMPWHAGVCGELYPEASEWKPEVQVCVVCTFRDRHHPVRQPNLPAIVNSSAVDAAIPIPHLLTCQWADQRGAVLKRKKVKSFSNQQNEQSFQGKAEGGVRWDGHEWRRDG